MIDVWLDLSFKVLMGLY